MRKKPGILIVCAVFLLCICIPGAGATPPPPDGRVYYLLPGPSGPYGNQSVDLGFSITSGYSDERKPSVFPPLSKYRIFRSFISERTGKSFFSEVWYFNDGSGFSENRQHLFDFLQQQGTVTPVILDITGDLARTNDPYIAGLHARHIRVTQYTSEVTSGYFLIFSTDFFPGENYYIAYYGTEGHSDLAGSDPSLKILIMSCYPGFVENRKYTYDPVSQGYPIPHPSPVPFILLLPPAIIGYAYARFRLKRR